MSPIFMLFSYQNNSGRQFRNFINDQKLQLTQSEIARGHRPLSLFLSLYHAGIWTRYKCKLQAWSKSVKTISVFQRGSKTSNIFRLYCKTIRRKRQKEISNTIYSNLKINGCHILVQMRTQLSPIFNDVFYSKEVYSWKTFAEPTSVQNFPFAL